MGKVNLWTLNQMKNEGRPITWVTAYDLPFAFAAEKAGVDMILIGDSGGMIQLGYKSTNPVTMDEMISFSKAVRTGAPNTFIVGDMPQGSYEVSDEKAVENAMRFVKEAACDSVKLEGGRRVVSRVKAIVDAGILVVGHLGLTPQSISKYGGYSIQGKTRESFEEIMEDALALQEAGAVAILLEAMPAESAAQIAKNLDIPILGIGVGDDVDGQLMLTHDLLGFYQTERPWPWFAKNYVREVIEEFKFTLSDKSEQGANTGLGKLIVMAIERFVQEVRSKKFPGKECTYMISDNELNDLMMSKYWKK